MKKKVFATIIALVMFAMTACGGAKAPDSQGGPGAASGLAKLKMATGAPSGMYYGFSGVVAQVLNKELKGAMDITVESTGASKANIQLVAADESQMAIIQNDVMSYAYYATDMFEGEEPEQSFSAVMSCYPEIVQIIANKSITSIEEIKGKRISVGNAGSGSEFNARQVLAAYGISFDDVTVNNQSYADSADSIKNGSIDAAFIVAGLPATAIMELATGYEFNLLSMDDAHVKALQDDYSFYTDMVIPGGTYNGIPEDTRAVAVMATIIARNDVPKDTVYAFVKGMFDYKADITEGHAKGDEIDLGTAVSGISIPFHPGAEKYFAEESGGL